MSHDNSTHDDDSADQSCLTSIKAALADVFNTIFNHFIYGRTSFSESDDDDDNSQWTFTMIVWCLLTFIILFLVAGCCYCFMLVFRFGKSFLGPDDMGGQLDVNVVRNILWTGAVVGLGTLSVYYMFYTDSDSLDSASGGGSGFYSSPFYPWRPSVPKDTLEEPVESGAVGLANLGNSCYMSASLQCLNSVPALRQFFLDEDCENHINIENPLGSGGKAVGHFRDLIVRMWSDKISIAAPVRFKKMVGELNCDFGGRRQQDAEEFLGWLLDQLHEDLNDARRGVALPNRMRGVSFDALTDIQRAQQSDAEFFARNRSPIVDMFFGQQSSSLKWCVVIVVVVVFVVTF